MSHNLSDLDEFTSPVPTPDILDTTYPAVVKQALQYLTNRTQFLFNRLATVDSADAFYLETADGHTAEPGVLTAYLTNPQAALGTPDNPFTYNNREIARTINWVRDRVPGLRRGAYTYALPLISMATQNFLTQLSSNVVQAVQTAASGGDYIALPLQLPISGTLSNVGIKCIGDRSTTAAGLPSTKPKLKIYRVDYLSNPPVATLLGSTDDPSANLSAYRANHTIYVNGLDEDLSETSSLLKSYHAVVNGEGGTNAASLSFAVTGLSCLITGATAAGG